MLVLIGPSASGKTEIANLLIKEYKMHRMVTYTTREKRIGEIDGVSYNFVSKEKFLSLKDNDEFVETVVYNNNYYGTLKKDVSFDKIVILEPNGLKAFKEKMPKEITSFYLDTNEEVRMKRMNHRMDKEEDINKRIINDRSAFKDIPDVDYVINNNDISLEEISNKIYTIYEEKK